MTFKLDSFFNPCLAPGATRVDAILTVTSDGAAPAASVSTKCVAFLVDCSGSMFKLGKIEAARHALRKAIAALPAHVLFTVIAFGQQARTVFPMRPASDADKREADRLVQKLDNMGGTAMSTALRTAREAFASEPGAICFAYFLTDGINEGESPSDLAAELGRCRDVFQCDCRGVGTDWMADQLRLISNTLLGTADAVPDPAGLEADFRASLQRALDRSVADVRLDLWTPATSKLVTLRQMQPETVDITGKGAPLTPRVTGFGLGAYGREQRDYCATFAVEPGEIDDELLVCRPSLVWTDAGGEHRQDGTKVVATWSADADLTARISPEVAHYTGQTELAAAIKEGLEARDRGNEGEATRLLGRAAQIAHESGNEEVTRRLAKVVDVVDADAGTVRLRAADKGAALELEMGGTRTVRRGTGR